MTRTNKLDRLELTWPSKSKLLLGVSSNGDPQWSLTGDVERRILFRKKSVGEVTEYHPAQSLREAQNNVLIQGDNLIGLKSLQRDYHRGIQCIYIDPPFNTGNAFEHYDDGLTKTIWLSLMRSRLEILITLLSDTGFIFIHLDDNSIAEAKLIMDEALPDGFVNMITMSTNEPSGFKATARGIFDTANYLLVYSKKPGSKLKKLYIRKEYDKAYNRVLENPAESMDRWRWVPIKDAVLSASSTPTTLTGDVLKRAIADYAVTHADRVFRTAPITGGARAKRLQTIEQSRRLKDSVLVHPDENLKDFYILNGEQILFYSQRMVEVNGERFPGQVLTNVWTDIGWTGIAKEGGVKLKNGKKPEALLQRIIEISSAPGDWVLDSFLGSGTTCAVAHKMRRRWIGIEQGAQAETMCLPRLSCVVEGSDRTGVTASENWEGGGGFVFYELGPPLVCIEDLLEAPVIDHRYYNGDLIRAVCFLLDYDLLEDRVLHGRRGAEYIHVAETPLTNTYVDYVINHLEKDSSVRIFYDKRAEELRHNTKVTFCKIPAALMR